MIPLGEYLPDLPGDISYLIGGSNAFPRPNKTYGPVASLSVAITSLALRAQGAAYTTDTAGNVALWAGTAGKLYRLTGSNTFSDVSKAATTYSCASTDFWEFEQFGSYIIATQFGNLPQKFLIGTDTNFTDLNASAPQARHTATVANFLMFGNTFDGTGGNQPQRLWWPAIGDPTNWQTPGTSAAAAVQSGYTNLQGRGGWIQAIVPKVGQLDAVIVQERNLWRCQYVGSPDVFAFQPMETGRGSPASQSIMAYGGLMFFLGDDGFYMCDGAQTYPIGAGKVDKTFYQDLNQSYINRVQGVIDPINKLAIWGYPSNSSTDGHIDTLLMYSWIGQLWSPPTQVNIECLTKLGTVGYTLEQLDAFGTLDSLPASLDSRIWAGGGKPVLAAFDTTHALGYFTGTTLAATFTTGDMDGQGKRFFVRGVRPQINGIGANITAAIGYRETTDAAYTFTSDVGLARNNVAPFRVNTRYPAVTLKVGAGSNWTHAEGFELDVADAGSM